MTAAQELFIDCFMAGAAIRRCDPRIDDKTIVIRAALAHGHLMAIQAGDAFLRVLAQLKLVDDGILQVPMALGALAARTNEGCARLIHFRPRTARVHEKSRDHQASGQSDCDKDSAKSHRGLMMPMLVLVRGLSKDSDTSGFAIYRRRFAKTIEPMAHAQNGMPP